jgi:hypothetical protein
LLLGVIRHRKDAEIPVADDTRAATSSPLSVSLPRGYDPNTQSRPGA